MLIKTRAAILGLQKLVEQGVIRSFEEVNKAICGCTRVAVTIPGLIMDSVDFFSSYEEALECLAPQPAK